MKNNLQHKNNFDFLRLLFSSFVIVSHASGLSGKPFYTFFPQVSISLSNLGVWGFFVISGYLVSGSLDRSGTILRYSQKRIRRIFPGLIIAALLSTFILGLLITTLDKSQYLLSKEVYLHFFTATFLIPKYECLPGLFTNNPYTCAVNGSLWTLRYEVFFYLLFALLFLFSIKQKKRILLGLLPVILFCVYVSIFQNGNGKHALAYYFKYFSLLFYFFLTGAIFHYYPLVNKSNCKKLSLFFIPLLIVCCFIPYSFSMALLPIVFPVSVISFGLLYTPQIDLSSKIGDVSYGMYIYGFTIQQGILQLFPSIDVYVLLVISWLLSLVMGYFSWHLVEKKWLKRSV